MFTKTISTYLFRLYCRYFSVVSLIIAGALLLSNIFDVLQKFKSVNIPPNFFWKLALYKIPYLLSEVVALISFISMFFFLRRLTKHNELLIIMCNGGIQFWRVMMIPVFTTLLIGLVIIAIVNPIGTYGLEKYDQLEAKLTKKKHLGFTVTTDGISFFEEYQDTNKIIRAKSINISTKELKDIIILFMDSKNNFLKRYDVQTAILNSNKFNLINVKIYTNKGIEEVKELDIPTNLSINSFTDSFILPEMLSIWSLPNFIDKFLKSGLPVTKYKIHFYKQIFKPLMMIATVILASCFVNLIQRNDSQKKNMIIALFCGVTTYSLIEVTIRMLAYNGLDPLLAVALPITLMMLISNFVVLHLQEA